MVSTIFQYFCVSANNANDNSELNLANNKVCQIQNGIIQTSELYPNPANKLAFIDVVSLNSVSMNIEVIDAIGKKVITYNFPPKKEKKNYTK